MKVSGNFTLTATRRSFFLGGGGGGVGGRANVGEDRPDNLQSGGPSSSSSSIRCSFYDSEATFALSPKKERLIAGYIRHNSLLTVCGNY